MKRVFFLGWPHRFNLEMHSRNLLEDNASFHDSIEIANVRVCYFPPKMTTFLQPLDAGIIKRFKGKYKKLLVRWVDDQLEVDGNVSRMDVVTTIKFSVDVWADVSSSTVQSCWRHTGIVPALMSAVFKSSSDYVDADDLPDLNALIRHFDLANPLDADAYIDIEKNFYGASVDTASPTSDVEGDAVEGWKTEKMNGTFPTVKL
ncbi:putative DDE superfamily endonuclease domain-containing protein [Plasmopara halstedii]